MLHLIFIAGNADLLCACNRKRLGRVVSSISFATVKGESFDASRELSCREAPHVPWAKTDEFPQRAEEAVLAATDCSASKSFIMMVRGAILFLACGTAACWTDREAPGRAQLDSLIREGATREEVARQLGAGYEVYKKNTELWKDLERDLRKNRELRERAERYPKIMF